MRGTHDKIVTCRIGVKNKTIRPRGYIKLFSCSSQLSIKFIMCINVKMPTIVGILTFISMVNTTYESLKAIKVFILKHCCWYEHLKLYAQLRWARKKFYNVEAWNLFSSRKKNHRTTLLPFISFLCNTSIWTEWFVVSRNFGISLTYLYLSSMNVNGLFDLC